MLKSCFLVVVFILCISGLSHSQTEGEIVGVTYGDPSYKFSTLDVLTKSDSVVSTVGSAIIWQGNSTYDKIHKRYFGKNGTYIYAIDAQTGALLDSIPNLNAFSGIEYNEGCDCLMGIYYNANTSNLYFASVDFYSKNLNLISYVQADANYFGESTFDQVGQRYFRARLSSIEVLDVAGNQLALLPRPNSMSCFEYDETMDRLIGVYFGVTSLVITSVDLLSQQVLDIDSLELTSGLLAGESTFDPARQRYFFRTMDDIHYYDLQYMVSDSYPNPSPYITGIEYKQPPPLPPVNTTAIPEQTQHTSIMVYPNPGTGNFFFSGLKPGSRIKIFNHLGQTIYDLLSESENVNVLLKNKEVGIYFYEISVNGRPEKKGKLVIR